MIRPPIGVWHVRKEPEPPSDLENPQIIVIFKNGQIYSGMLLGFLGLILGKTGDASALGIKFTATRLWGSRGHYVGLNFSPVFESKTFPGSY